MSNMRFARLLALLSLFPPLAQAQTYHVPPAKKPRTRAFAHWEFVFSDSAAKQFSNGAQDSIQNLVNTTFVGVRWFPPPNKNNFFDWKGDRTVLANKTFSVEIFVSPSDPELKPLIDDLEKTGGFAQ